jgi:hypothetical protein
MTRTVLEGRMTIASRKSAVPGGSIARSAGLACALIALAGARPASAQSPAHRHGGHTPAPTARAGAEGADAVDPSHAVHDAMSGAMDENPHLRMSPHRVATAADSARAARIVREARSALARYRDVRVAERDGYRMFAPNVKGQRVYHFTKMGSAIRAQFRFDAARPTSLLYRKGADGSLRLVGAMYTAPRDASWEELNERVPLGIARWHLHTNMCVPRIADRERWREVRDGRPVFGPASPIATREACDAVKGRFLPTVFNWMVHANVFEDDVWGDEHQGTGSREPGTVRRGSSTAVTTRDAPTSHR